MSKIEILIKELCPEGVERVKLGEVMTIQRGASPRPIRDFMSDSEHGIPWIKIGDVSPEDKYITDTKEFITQAGVKKSRLLKAGDFILSNSMSFGRPYILQIDGCIHDGWISMSNFENDIHPGYLYQILRSNSTQDYWKMKANDGGAMTNLNADIVRDTTIPLPPLPIQQKIVSVLDKFTEQISYLDKSIELRQKQYEYYREKLLTFEEGECEWKKLGEISTISRGIRVVKRELQETGAFPVFQNSIAPMGYYDKSNVPGDTVYVITAGSSSGSVGYQEKAYWAADDCVYIIPQESLLSKYVLHNLILRQKRIKANVRQGAMPRLSRDVIEKFQIPVPPLATQRSIVATLDKFETLIADLKQLRELRQKQYEYYREKLLTF